MQRRFSVGEMLGDVLSGNFEIAKYKFIKNRLSWSPEDIAKREGVLLRKVMDGQFRVARSPENGHNSDSERVWVVLGSPHSTSRLHYALACTAEDRSEWVDFVKLDLTATDTDDVLWVDCRRVRRVRQSELQDFRQDLLPKLTTMKIKDVVLMLKELGL